MIQSIFDFYLFIIENKIMIRIQKIYTKIKLSFFGFNFFN